MAQIKPKITLLAIGGTIAGKAKNSIVSTLYKSGVVGIDELVNTIDELKDLADISVKQIANIDSANISDVIWLELVEHINIAFSRGADAIVLTHGTDTLEESAYFLSLVLKSDKPVVLVGAMRPSTALSADGPKNLYNAVALAVSQNARGVLVTMNDRIFKPRELVKTHSFNVNAFSSLSSGDLGYIVDGQPVFYNKSTEISQNLFFNIKELKVLPKVDILYSYANDGSGVAAQALFQNGTQGLVIAGSGAGSIHKDHKDMLKRLLKQGLFVVVSSRVLCAAVVLSDEDKSLGFISAHNLNPQKARILLSLALTETKDIVKIQNYFLNC
ncbi:asparaginase [Campylobacter sp. MIT 21-1685]|uniref:asparaginase n=1 Tax=unclassified Campylobacter TaxID=2593542 RepID=UPI00224BA08B|nr:MULTISPECIES: asparaginase [unclassified Campylobacter]MCX2683471.1 asparaginase [Campylobacter sp. MIT 21-1684]MCX2751707.1 asparaginase [Campylobacter sp. MIT 21-1682]MCX2807909.1 asparaginase [Campylobacter sp. MIT 21-1685]